LSGKNNSVRGEEISSHLVNFVATKQAIVNREQKYEIFWKTHNKSANKIIRQAKNKSDS
jgi:hypothetical protein